MTRVLLTNDDGIDSPGLHALARVARSRDLEVTVAAPHEDRSGTSASLTALQEDGRLVVWPTDIGLPQVRGFSVEATPAFIVHAACAGAFGAVPELVLCGINLGPNVGHAVLHSGTVGAALTAATLGLPAAAFSLTSAQPEQFETASEAAGQVIDHLLHHRDGPAAHIGKAFNVNSPDVPIAEHHGLRNARLAHFGAVQAKIGETGEGYVTMEFNPPEAHPKPDSDAALLSQGWSTVTVLAPPARVEAPGLAPGVAW